MRSFAIIAAGLATSVIAAPLEARDVVWETDVEVATSLIVVTKTLTAGQKAAAETAPAAVQSAPASSVEVAAQPTSTAFRWGNLHGQGKAVWRGSQGDVHATIASDSTTTEGVVAFSSAWTSTYTMPAETSEAATTTYQAPAETTTKAPVKTTTQAPVESTTQVAVPASSASASAAPSALSNYQQKVITHHNVHRANHSSSDVTWDDALAATAMKIAQTCNYAHSMNVDGGGYGQNIAAGVSADDVSSVITNLFYNGEVSYYNGLYGQANPDMTNFEKWGHFSQIVWKGTNKVGCATYHCSGGLANVGQYVSPDFTVCNYGTPGNYAGEYAENVGDSLKQPSVDASYTGGSY